jgi:hypothetical protein
MSQATRILLSLLIGLAGGVALASFARDAVPGTIAVAEPIGAAWLHGLQMTIVPLVVSLLVTGVASTAEAARAGRLAGRAIALYVTFLFLSAVIAAIATPLILAVAPLPAASAQALRAALVGAGKVPNVPPLGEFFAGIVPTNIVHAAASDAFLSLIIFTLVFAFAIARIDAEGRALLVRFFTALRDTMLVVIDWVLWIAPLGVFALALVVGARAGSGAFGALAHYILVVASVGVIVTLLAYPVAWLGARINLADFARGAPVAGSGDQHAILARLGARDAGGRARAWRAGAHRRGDAAARRCDFPHDRAGDEPRRRDLRRDVVQCDAVARDAGDRRGGGDAHLAGLGQPARHRQLRQCDRTDRGHDRRTHRPARPAGRGRDDPRHHPHCRQRHHGPCDHRLAGPARA